MAPLAPCLSPGCELHFLDVVNDVVTPCSCRPLHSARRPPAAFGEEGVAAAYYSDPFLDVDGLGGVADILAPELGRVSLSERIL